MAFDIDRARADGKSDEQIARFLSSNAGFDLDRAISDGKSYTDVANFLASGARRKAHTPRSVNDLPDDLEGLAEDAASKVEDKKLDQAESTKHSVGYMGRAALEGLGDLGQLAMQLTPAYSGIKGLNDLTKGVTGNNTAPLEILDRNLGEYAADKMGLDKSKTDGEKLFAAGIRGVAPTLVTLPVAGVMKSTQALKGLGDFLSAAPVQQLAGSVGAGIAPELAKQQGAGEGEQFIAGLAGGLAPSLPKALLGGAKNLATPIVNKGYDIVHPDARTRMRRLIKAPTGEDFDKNDELVDLLLKYEFAPSRQGIADMKATKKVNSAGVGKAIDDYTTLQDNGAAPYFDYDSVLGNAADEASTIVHKGGDPQKAQEVDRYINGLRDDWNLHHNGMMSARDAQDYKVDFDRSIGKKKFEDLSPAEHAKRSISDQFRKQLNAIPGVKPYNEVLTDMHKIEKPLKQAANRIESNSGTGGNAGTGGYVAKLLDRIPGGKLLSVPISTIMRNPDVKARSIFRQARKERTNPRKPLMNKTDLLPTKEAMLNNALKYGLIGLFGNNED